MILVGIMLKERPFNRVVNYPLSEAYKSSINYFNIPSKGIYEYNLDERTYGNMLLLKNDNLELLVTKNMNRDKDKIK